MQTSKLGIGFIGSGFNARFHIRSFVGVRDADVRGMLLFNATPAELASVHAALVAGLENGSLRPIVGREFPLAAAPEAHRAVLAPDAFGKIVLLP